MERKFIDFFIESVKTNIEQFSSLKPELRGERKGVSKDKDVYISAIIGLIGEVQGTVTISFKKELALKIASVMLMEEKTEIDYDARDAIGEIANLIIGQARNKIVEQGFDSKITPPTIIEGFKHEVFYKPGLEIEELEFEDNEKNIFYLTVGLKINQKRSSFIGLIMAGGIGTRMKSKTNKLLHKILGREVIRFPVEAFKEAEAKRIILITGEHNQKLLKNLFNESVEYALQKEPLGTGDAVKSAIPLLKNYKGDVLVTVGDNPYLDTETVKEFFDFHKQGDYDVSIITTDFDNPPPYGRIVKDENGKFVKLVEEIVATEEELKIKEVSSSIFLFKWDKILPYLQKIDNNNPKGEYFLPDAINFLAADGGEVGIFWTEKREITKGINTREDLIEAISYFNRKNINKFVKNGITFVSPENTFVEFGVDIGNDSIIYPFNYLRSGLKIKEGSIIPPFYYLNI